MNTFVTFLQRLEDFVRELSMCYVTMLQCDSSIHLCCKGVLIIFLMCRSGISNFLEFTILFQNFVGDV